MKYMSPANMITIGAAVSGTVETGYDPNALCDGDPQNPVRTTSTGASFTAVGNSINGVNGVVLAHTNLDAGINVTIGGGLSGTLVTPIVFGDGIPRNGWKEVTPANTGTVSISLAGNSQTVVLGELIAGVLEQVDLLTGATYHEDDYRMAGDSVTRRVGYDMGYAARLIDAQMIVTSAQLASIEAWRRASRQTSRPSVIIPFEDSNDAILVIWSDYQVQPWEGDYFQVSASWQELTRTRW